MLEANPRASRTVPFVSKADGPAAGEDRRRLMLGETIDELGLPGGREGLGSGTTSR